jgi:hypothetical protein
VHSKFTPPGNAIGFKQHQEKTRATSQVLLSPNNHQQLGQSSHKGTVIMIRNPQTKKQLKAVHKWVIHSSSWTFLIQYEFQMSQ